MRTGAVPLMSSCTKVRTSFLGESGPRTSCFVTDSSRACAMTFAVALARAAGLDSTATGVLSASLRPSPICAAMNCACRNPSFASGQSKSRPVGDALSGFPCRSSMSLIASSPSHHIRFCTRTFPEEPNCAVPRCYGQSSIRALTRLRITARSEERLAGQELRYRNPREQYNTYGISPGDYTLGVRRPEFDWRYSPDYPMTRMH